MRSTHAGFPGADVIALAIVTACRLTGDMPIATCMRQTSRARHVAFVALTEAFPDAKKVSLARLTGYAKPAQWQPLLQSARRASWWDDKLADQVRRAIDEAVCSGVAA